MEQRNKFAQLLEIGGYNGIKKMVFPVDHTNGWENDSLGKAIL